VRVLRWALVEEKAFDLLRNAFASCT